MFGLKFSKGAGLHSGHVAGLLRFGDGPLKQHPFMALRKPLRAMVKPAAHRVFTVDNGKPRWEMGVRVEENSGDKTQHKRPLGGRRAVVPGRICEPRWSFVVSPGSQRTQWMPAFRN